MVDTAALSLCVVFSNVLVVNSASDVKTFEDYLNDNFFYKFGELFRSLVGSKFMVYEGDNLVTKTIKDVTFNGDVEEDQERKKYVEDKNKFVAMHELPMKDDYTGYKLYVYVISDDEVHYNFNEIYLIPSK